MKNILRKKQYAPVMVWAVTDKVIEEPETLRKEFQDINAAGFGGIAASVRCSRYSWDDPPARAALLRISRLCREAKLQLWIGPDPRFVSHKLIGDAGGVELVLFGNASRADVVPNTAEVSGGRFTVRCALPPRHVHTLTTVAVEFTPVALVRVYAVRTTGRTVGNRDVRDITGSSQMFYNARDRYVEAFGRLSLHNEQEWRIVAFFQVRTNHFDFSSDTQLRGYEQMLVRLKQSGVRADGVMWDEPGYTCVYGSLPFSKRIRKGYQSSTGRPLERDLWKLAYESEDRSHIPVRVAYYRTVQDTTTRAERRFQSTVVRLWGRGTVVGIHDTWHFESADMCDMNHGSLNLWETARYKSGGFVDLGGVQQLHDPSSGWYSSLAAMTVTAPSLGKVSENQIAFNNLWTVGDDAGSGSQREAMDHCVKTLALFGSRWLAHAYGPVGTIGEERSFLGSPPLPGYPEHSTWREFPRWNDFLSRQLAAVNGRLPKSNLLVLYPVEAMYARADSRADRSAQQIFDFLLRLLDNHYHVDVLATSEMHGFQWRGSRLCRKELSYEIVVYPFPEIIDADVYRVLRQRSDRVILAFEQSYAFASGRRANFTSPRFGLTVPDLLALLGTHPELRPVLAPAGTWVTMTPCEVGMIVSVAPSRCSGTYSGRIALAGNEVNVGLTSDLRRFFFPQAGDPFELNEHTHPE